MTMVTLGVDAHKRTHTVVAVDALGRPLAEQTVSANRAGHSDALRWASQWPERCWAMEDCRHVSRAFEHTLLEAGESVVRVPPRLTMTFRKAARVPGKSDAIDALAVARAMLREPSLPPAQKHQPARELRLLVDHRDDLIAERTRTENRLRWLLHELAPEMEPAPRTVHHACVLARIEDYLQLQSGMVARIAREKVSHCRYLTQQIDALEREIGKVAAKAAPSLLSLPGCGPLTAAKIVGEVGGVTRFHSRAAFARHNGTAPVPACSGMTQRFRLSRSGNRQLNSALHRIAVTQLRIHEPAKAYIARRTTQGDTKREAIRALRRHLSNQVYRCLLADATLTLIQEHAA